MSLSSLIHGSARAIAGLAPVITGIEDCPVERADCTRAIARGYFTPEEDARLRAWFARYLTARFGLLEIIEELRPIAFGSATALDEASRIRCFTLAYAAACLLVKEGRFLVDEFAPHKLVQRKLNEADPHHRIPRKQYTAVFRSLTRPLNAWRLHEAVEFADQNRKVIDALSSDPVLGTVVEILRATEESLRVGLRTYLKSRVRYRWHSWRRRRATATQSSLFRIAEAFGRVIAEVVDPWHEDRVTDAHRQSAAALLRPGDVLIARHDRALSNLFLPGYWPHAALHIGGPSVLDSHSIEIPSAQAGRWIDPLCVLEARKDGVLFRPLHDTLAVDAFTILRPKLDAADIARAIANAVVHEGKLYNFDFDFFTADRLVCTEVVYRAFEGVGDISFELSSRGGRLTLSAEDLIDMAIVHGAFEPVAVFGTPNVGDRLVTGAEAAEALAQLRKSELGRSTG